MDVGELLRKFPHTPSKLLGKGKDWRVSYLSLA
jgi:hypothetical protein